MRKTVTAAELMAKLERDPAFLAMRARKEEDHRTREREAQQAEAPLVQDLRSAGLQVDSVWDLVNASHRSAAAVPILLAHLQRPYPPAIREGVARALAVPEAVVAWRLLVGLYREESDPRLREAFAVALAGCANRETLADLISLARDVRQGSSRILLLQALERSPDPGADVALSELATDPVLSEDVGAIVRRRRIDARKTVRWKRQSRR
jgi:hypothetical protein